MKRLIISCVFILLGVFVADRLGGVAMWWVNQHTQDISGPKMKYLVNEVHEDVLLLGTSRCNLHYVPSILMDSLGMSVYNGGIDASNCIYAHYYILNHILAHHTPKVICLEVMTSDYARQADAFETTSFFAPYVGKNDCADSIFREAGTYWTYRLSHLYRYNAKAVSNMGGLLLNKQSEGEHGYLPIARPAHFPDKPEKQETPAECDSLKLHYLRKFITLCRERDIKLVFMVSPAYRVASADLYDVLKEVASEYEIPFLDYHSQGLYLDHPEYFKDKSHLWDKGARLYTAVFAHDLKRILKY